LTGLLATLKGLPSAYDKDLQEDKPPVFAAFDALSLLLPVVAGVIATLSANTERMRAALDSSLLATELADYLVRKGVPFREAHHIVGQAVQLAERQAHPSGGLAALTLTDLRTLSPAFQEDVAEVWDFQAAVTRRSALGGTSPEAVRRQIQMARQTLQG
jgi:argininosuccinate lyase